MGTAAATAAAAAAGGGLLQITLSNERKGEPLARGVVWSFKSTDLSKASN